jgi:hypothetical protein
VLPTAKPLLFVLDLASMHSAETHSWPRRPTTLHAVSCNCFAPTLAHAIRFLLRTFTVTGPSTLRPLLLLAALIAIARKP